MSEKVVGNQYVYNGAGYLDGKIQPVENVSDLNKILIRHRFIGLTVTVIHPDGPDSKPADYWLVQDPNKGKGVLMWERKTTGGGSDITVDTNTPDYLTVTRSGDTFYVDAAGDFVGELDDMKDAISGLTTAITETNERITTEVERLGTRIDTEVSALAETINTVSERVEVVNDRIDTEVSAITETITREVNTINERIDTVESSLTETITTEVNNLNERIDSEVSALTETITNEVNTINERIDSEVSSLTETITTEVERLDGSISALTETVTNEIERIDAKDSEQDARLDEISQWHIEKLGEDSGLTQYALVDASGNPIGDTIDIIDEQYLESVVYIPSATQEDVDIDPSVIIGDPYLKFIWKYDIVTYVAIKDWVNDYFAGSGIAISAGHEISVKLADVEEGNENYLSIDDNGGLRMNMFIEIDDM